MAYEIYSASRENGNRQAYRNHAVGWIMELRELGMVENLQNKSEFANQGGGGVRG